MTVFDVSGFNGKRHWGNKVERGEEIVERMARGRTGADITGGNELDARMLVGMKKAGFQVHKGSSNGPARQAWNGNAVAWSPEEWVAEETGQMRVPLRYWPGKKFRGRRFVWYRKMVIHFPWARLRNKKTNELVMVMAVHFPTPFNSKPKTRARIERDVEGWLTRRQIPAIVIGDTNRMKLTNSMIQFITVKEAVGIWINQYLGVESLGTVNLTGLSDHKRAPKARLRTKS